MTQISADGRRGNLCRLRRIGRVVVRIGKGGEEFRNFLMWNIASTGWNRVTSMRFICGDNFFFCVLCVSAVSK